MFRRVKGYVWGGETWSLGRWKLMFRGARAKLSENEEWRMKSEESAFTQFNISFITFPWQVFVGIFHIFPTKERPLTSFFFWGRNAKNARRWRLNIHSFRRTCGLWMNAINNTLKVVTLYSRIRKSGAIGFHHDYWWQNRGKTLTEARFWDERLYFFRLNDNEWKKHCIFVKEKQTT
jgi:hypothetical protein